MSLFDLRPTLSERAKTWRLVCDGCGELPDEVIHGCVQGDECNRCFNEARDSGGSLYWVGDHVPYGGFDFGRPSHAVVACAEGEGVVLWYVGGYIELEVVEGGLRSLADLGLDDAPRGISVWVGKIIIHETTSFEGDHDYESETKGEFREPSKDEWEAIHAGRNPWNYAKWMLQFPVTV